MSDNTIKVLRLIERNKKMRKKIVENCKIVGNKVLGHCYYSPIKCESVEIGGVKFQEVELKAKMPKGKIRQVAFLIRLKGKELLVKEVSNEETRIKLYPVNQELNEDDWLKEVDEPEKELELLSLKDFYRRKANKRAFCRNGVFKLPVYFDKEDLDKMIYLSIYPSLIEGEERLVIDSSQMVLKKL